MIHSMTGYGQGAVQHEDKHIKVDIRTLNSKSTDIRMKVPLQYKSKELEIRNILMSHISRGKVDVTITIDSPMGEEEYKLNTPLIETYMKSLTELTRNQGIERSDVLQSVMRIPSVVSANIEEVSEAEWLQTKRAVETACDKLNQFRKEEGKALESELEKQNYNIQNLLSKVDNFEGERITKLRERLEANIEKELTNTKVDNSRFEQEIFYYVEKLDISEEKSRLAHHCSYFLETLQNSEELVGKKLTFISQEMGREINTLGAKAQHTEIQRLVVNMKDALEKIKEQLANVL